MKRNLISERASELPVLTIGKLLHIAEEDKSIISLGPGEPDFTAPKNIIAAAKRALDKGFTHYSPAAGRKDLKEAIIRKLRKDNRIHAGPENIVVTTGSTEAIMLALMCTIDPGEGVMYPDPGFLAYRPSIEALNGMALPIPLHEEDGFQIDVERMERQIVPEKTNVLILNSPSNPTGTVFSKKALEEVAGFAMEYDLLIIADEAYEKLVYGGAKHISIGSLNGMEDRVLTLHSFSKTYAMPGFRLGYAVGEEKLIAAMTKMHLFTSLCAPTLSQVAAIEALKGPQTAVRKMVREYDRRRRMIIRRLSEIQGFRCTEPKGAFYAFPNISHYKMKSYKFAEWLLKNAKVAVVPGTEFGRMGEWFIRCSYATEYKKIGKAMDNIERAVRRLG
ncbi:MAG TPA: pyridoxal phosphate-dependent aminotransferase [archaeon]|nr:pyridoxal phosphate-dependent aminotransferase [archaeon]